MVPPVQAQDPPRDFSQDRGFLIAKATTLPRGEGYVIAMVPGTLGIGYGVTDRVTLNAGAVPWLLLDGALVAFSSLRYGMAALGPVHLAVGGFGLIASDDDAVEVAGWPYLTATVGSGDYSVSGLIGVGSSTTVFESDFDGAVILQAEGEARVLRNVKVIVEALSLGQGSDPIFGAGLRLWGDRGMFEAGAAWVFGATEAALPWAAIAWRF
jgi:hypothetical protein